MVWKYGGTNDAGDRTTIHQTGEVNIELDDAGKVVSVWFRCMLLPFTQNGVDAARAADMRGAYERSKPPPIHAIEFEGDHPASQARRN